ncbi:MAG: hypothetical protein CMO34_06965 [Verrucomicrobia bacterium]|nr:hypothetical protein [Verrucomicrobiota bacterium]
METLIDQEKQKRAKYQSLLPQIKALLEGEDDLVANMANVAAALKSSFNFFWVGFYRFDGKELVLGPFQGPVACTRIDPSRGVCGKAYRSQESIVVPDVHAFDDHIACSPLSKSEIVVPIMKENKVVLLLDVDSDTLNDFSAVDKEHLEMIANQIAALL